MSNASNAVLARVRTMYGKRLRASDYANLISCQNNADIANYLKTRTEYGDIFTSTTGVNVITAEVIEFTLNKYLETKLQSLCSFQRTINDSFYQLYVVKSDIKVIISAARNIVSSSGRASSYIPGAFFKSRSALDIQKVYNSATAGELLGSLERTKYYQTAKKMFDADGNFNLLNFEIAMLEYYATAAKELGKNFSADSRKDFYELIDLEIDTFNISYIFRQQKLGVSNERIISNIITTHGTIPRRKLMELINAGSDITFTELLGKTKVGKNFSADDFSYIEGVFERNVYKINKHYLRFSTNPDISVITFISLATTEIDNITHIVEGKRYDMPNDEIQKFLVGVE